MAARSSIVRCLYKQLFPRYITDFRNPDINVRPGFNAFCLDYPWMLDAYGADGLYDLVCDVADVWWRNRRRYLKRIHTEAQWEVRKAEYGFKCAYCGRGDVKLTKDHIYPISRQGTDHIDNIVPACLDCNRRKRAKDAEQFKIELTSVKG